MSDLPHWAIGWACLIAVVSGGNTFILVAGSPLWVLWLVPIVIGIANFAEPLRAELDTEGIRFRRFRRWDRRAWRNVAAVGQLVERAALPGMWWVARTMRTSFTIRFDDGEKITVRNVTRSIRELQILRDHVGALAHWRTAPSALRAIDLLRSRRRGVPATPICVPIGLGKDRQA